MRPLVRAFAAVVALAGCGGGTAATTPTPSPSPAVAVAPSPTADPLAPSPVPRLFPIGTYTVTLTASQVSNVVIDEGTTTLALAPDGTYRTSNANEGTTTGVYFVEDSQITFRENGHSVCGSMGTGAERYGAGVYAWSFASGRLILRTVRDACDNGDRAILFSTAPWTRRA